MSILVALMLVTTLDPDLERAAHLAPQLEAEEVRAVSPYLRCLFDGEGQTANTGKPFDVTIATGREIADHVQARCKRVRARTFSYADGILRKKGIKPALRRAKIEQALSAFERANYLIVSAPEAHGKANAPH